MTSDLLDQLASIKDLAFWAKVRREDECWVWCGYIGRGGYGRLNRKEVVSTGSYSAHRYSWLLSYGAIPNGVTVCHTCDNRRCVRPDHLFLGTILDNMADMRKKGRSSRGERNSRAKMTEETVRQLRSRVQDGISQRQIAVEFGLTQSTVSHIATKRLWKHVP